MLLPKVPGSCQCRPMGSAAAVPPTADPVLVDHAILEGCLETVADARLPQFQFMGPVHQVETALAQAVDVELEATDTDPKLYTASFFRHVHARALFAVDARRLHVIYTGTLPMLDTWICKLCKRKASSSSDCSHQQVSLQPVYTSV